MVTVVRVVKGACQQTAQLRGLAQAPVGTVVKVGTVEQEEQAVLEERAARAETLVPAVPRWEAPSTMLRTQTSTTTSSKTMLPLEARVVWKPAAADLEVALVREESVATATRAPRVQVELVQLVLRHPVLRAGETALQVEMEAPGVRLATGE